jgi:hypothetical protein
MKYLKKYTLYERVSKETKIFESEQLLNNIEDIFREIEDTGLQIEYIRGDDNPTSSGIHFLM